MKDEPRRAAVVGLGAVTSLGLYPEAIAAAVAANVVRGRLVETMRDARTGAPMRLAMLPRLPLAMGAVARMRWMAERALAQALSTLEPLGERPPLSAYVAIPPPRPGPPQQEILDAVRSLLRAAPLPPAPGLCAAFDTGQEGGTAALGQALEVLKQRRADFCLVGGVDSYIDADLLAWLSETRRLSDDDNPNGIVPGEGAAFALLARPEVARQRRLPVLGWVLGATRAVEPSPWFTGRPTQARGLTRALADLFAGHPPEVKADVTYCDANGESWRADEWMYAYLRTSDRHADPLLLHHPAQCWGEVGAAAAPLLLAIALLDHRRGRGRGQRALLWCACDTRSVRGAALIEAEPGGSRPWE
jgi:3-oxoacyl-[acyl-carrier-protein] synthase-1